MHYNLVVEKELNLEGKKYISASRVSKKSGYNSDYLGQLCRAGKLDCRLVSRTWFVEENSLINHLKSGRKKSSPLIREVSNKEPKTASLKSEGFFNDNQKIVFQSLRSESLAADRLAKNFSLQRTVSNFFIAVFVVASVSVLVFDVANVLKKGEPIVADSFQSMTTGLIKIANPEFSSSSIKDAVKRGSDNFKFVMKSGFEKFSKSFSFLSSKNKIAKKDNAVAENNFSSLTLDERGVVTIPIHSDENPDAFSKVKNYLRDSFSDEIEFVPDESGVAGVIKPVFAEPTEEEYFYVMVPKK